MTNSDKKFWDEHGRVGLVWSNPNASDDALIAAASKSTGRKSNGYWNRRQAKTTN